MRAALDSPRTPSGSAANAAPARWLIVFAVSITLSIAGCAVFRRKGPTAEDVATSRELSRQGVAAMEMGQWQLAEDLLRKALTASAGDASTHRSMAEVLWHRGERQEALTQIELALEHAPDDATLRVRFGEMALVAGKRDEAIAHAERAIRTDSTLASAWALRGRCFQQSNQAERALADFHRALEFSPDDRDILQEVAATYRQRGQPARSLTTLHHLLDTYSVGEEPQQVLVLEGLVLLDMNRPRQAAEAFLAATQRGQPNVELFYNLAKAHSAAGEPDCASAAAQQALALDSSHQPTRLLLAQLAAGSNAGSVQRR